MWLSHSPIRSRIFHLVYNFIRVTAESFLDRIYRILNLHFQFPEETENTESPSAKVNLLFHPAVATNISYGAAGPGSKKDKTILDNPVDPVKK